MNTLVRIFNEVKYSALATVIVLGLWMLLADLPTINKYLELFVYATFGWMFLGGVAIPWVERKLEKLFG